MFVTGLTLANFFQTALEKGCRWPRPYGLQDAAWAPALRFSLSSPTTAVFSLVKNPIAEPSGNGGTNVIITFEDGADNDDNDTFLTMTLTPVTAGVISNAQRDADVVPESELQTFAAQDGMALSTNVEYSNGLTSDINIAIGAFDGRFTFAGFTVSTQAWGKVSGIVIDDTSSISRYNFLMLNFQLSEYARPAGQQPALWTHVLEGTDITVIVQ
ncbi:hypothetical protein K438DRAFT_1995531 [Mycena galopus ATCC 62051]|nr:hypothetical protein K438DRAFT_1995531 [Mycena galopus ATCC 62051]